MINNINELENENTGYALVTPLQLMTYIWSKYGTISDADHSRNENMRNVNGLPLNLSLLSSTNFKKDKTLRPVETKISMISNSSVGDIRTLKLLACLTVIVRSGARRIKPKNPGQLSRNIFPSPKTTARKINLPLPLLYHKPSSINPSR